MTISVIIPARQAAATLPRCLAAIADSTVAPLEILVVDDGSTDGTGDVARGAGARVVPVAGAPAGPAAARNLGAAAANGDVLVFLDADVAVHADTLAQIQACLSAHTEVDAVFGSYDDSPSDPGFVSQYRNLLHHFVHQEGRQEASTFWAGCGAVRRAAFAACGGFDERYRRPSIEDIELGGRLRAAGCRVWLRPEIQAVHLKRWTLFQTIRSDIVDRAIPWTRLILRHGQLPSDLNTAMRSRISASLAWCTLVLAAAGVVWTPALAPGAAAAGGMLVLNAPLYRFFARRRGIAFAAGAVAMHGLYLLYSSLVFAALAIASCFGVEERAREGADRGPASSAGAGERARVQDSESGARLDSPGRLRRRNQASRSSLPSQALLSRRDQ